MPTKPVYAAITLGSNSFNLQIAQTRAGKPCVVAKYARKVRLAEGIDCDGNLRVDAMQRGLDCLGYFAQMLVQHQVASSHVSVIATATLRRANNVAVFKQQALVVLGHPIEVISGMREAELIYRGMVATTPGQGRRLVLDIGGASTEFIIGDAQQILFKLSLPMGCVLYQCQYFNKPFLTLSQFDCVKLGVCALLNPHKQALCDMGWQQVVGRSGTLQAVIEILHFRTLPEVISLAILQQLKAEIINQADVALAGVKGLRVERAPTFAAGVAILLALFELLDIDNLVLSGGALREGVLHGLAARIGDTNLF